MQGVPDRTRVADQGAHRPELDFVPFPKEHEAALQPRVVEARRVAAPSVGGMITSAIYVLFLIPCLFVIGHDVRSRISKNVTSGVST